MTVAGMVNVRVDLNDAAVAPAPLAGQLNRTMNNPFGAIAPTDPAAPLEPVEREENSRTLPARGALQVCLVSVQATPNLTPLLDPAFGAQEVLLVVSADMRERARWLGEVLAPRGIRCTWLEVDDPWDLHALADRLLEWLAEQPSDRPVALNVTGGTKPMAMAAQQAFAVAGRPVFYVHQERDEVLWLQPRRAPTPLNNRLRLAPYLHAHGWQVVEQPPVPSASAALKALADDLVRTAGTLGPALGSLNWYAHRCQEAGLLQVPLEPRDLASGVLPDLIDRFAGTGACWLEQGVLFFADEAARFFCNGGWLEEHVAAVLASLRGPLGVQDAGLGVKVRSLANGLQGDAGGNELDLVFLARNRLHLIECKTRSFRERGSAAEAVYKLDALTALGGLNTRAMLVSYRPLLDGDRQRARDLGIRVVAGSALAQLGSELQRWVGPRR
jgi:hypothetical protein